MVQDGVIGLWFEEDLFDEEAKKNTPKRIKRMMEELRQWREWNDLERGRGIFHFEGYNDLVIVRDIPFTTWCVANETPIFTKRGWVKANEIKEGDIVVTYDIKQRRLVECKIIKVYKREVNELIEIVTETGKKLKCSYEHPIYVEGKGWVPAEDINVGDIVYVANFRKNSKMIEISDRRYWFGYFFGALQSDGTVWRNQIRLEVNDKQFAEKFAEAVKRVFGISAKVEKIKRYSSFRKEKINAYRVRVVNGMLVRFVKYVLGEVKHMKQRFPEHIIVNEDILRGYVDGYVDGDGYIERDEDGNVKRVVIYSKNREFLEEFAKMFSRMPYSMKDGMYAFVVPIEWYRGERKIVKNERELDISAIILKDKVVSVKIVRSRGVRKFVVYNFAVEGQETFFAGGILTHNCSHHLREFGGVVHVAYLPKDYVVGLSKIARTVRKFSAKPQIQEMLAYEIADYLYKWIPQVQGVMVIVIAEHNCMKCRGVMSSGRMVTSAIRGSIPKEEVLELLKISGGV